MITDATALSLYRRFAWQLETDRVVRAGFSEVSGLTADGDVVEYRAGHIVLKRGVTADRSLWDWRREAAAGVLRRVTGAIVLLDPARRPVARWTFYSGWPTKWEGPGFDAGGNEVAIETLEIAHEGLEVRRPP